MYERLPTYNDLNGDSLPKCRIEPALFKPQSKRAVRQATKRIGRADSEANLSVIQTRKCIRQTDTEDNKKINTPR